MKKILSLFFVGISLLTYAQKFQLTDTLGNPYTDGQTIAATISANDLSPAGDYATEIVVENLTATELNVQTFRTNIALPDGMRAYVCVGTACYPDDLFDIDLQVMDYNNTYALHIMPYENLGLCKFQIDFTADDQSMTLFVEVDMQELGVKDHSTNCSLSAYPNPAAANSNINVSYTLADKGDNNRLVIRNIVGAEVISMPLNPYDNKLAFDASLLKSGVYFYAIENKNHISIAKKLIIK
jgi:hypothetical protein